MYKKRYQCVCKSVDGSTYRIEIYKRGFNGSSMEVRLAGDMMTIERRAGSQLEPITISTARLSLYTEQDGVFEDLYSPEEHGALVRIYKDNSLYYAGSLDREQWSAPYSFERGYITEISFSDLAPLKFLPFEAYGLVSIIDFVKDSINKAVRPNDFGGSVALENLFNLKVSAIKHRWMSVIDDETLSNISYASSFERLKIAKGSLKHLNPVSQETSLHSAFIDTNVFVEDDKEKSVWWNALHDLLKATGLYIMQRNGKFVLYDVDALVERGAQETLVARSTDAELSIEPVCTKAIVEIDKKENTELFKHKNVEDDFGDKVLEWDFNRIDTEADREVLANKVEFYAPKTDTVIRGGAVYCNVTPHTAGSSDICVCAYAKPRNEYWHKPLIGGTIRHTLAHTTAFSTPYPLPKFADINNMKGDDGVYCTPVIPIPARTTEIMAKYQLALSLKFMLRTDYSLAQENKADPAFDRVIGKHIKKLTPKKIEHVYLWARIRALDEKGQVVAHLSNYGSTPDFLDPFLRPAWVDDNLPCLIEFGAENFGLGTFQAPNEQIARHDFASVYGEVYDKRFIFPLPPKGVAIEVVITDRFDILVKDPRKYGSLPYEQLQQAEDAEMARILRESYIQWVMMKDLGVDLVNYDGRDYEHKKIEYNTSNSSTTHELVEEKILLDTSDLLSPTSLSALKDREGRNLAPKCSRGFASGTLGELRIAHLMARSSGRHYRLSGTYKTPASFGCMVDPHKKTLYRVVEERERVLEGKSELALVEINRESISLVPVDISVVGIADRDYSIAHQFEDRIIGGDRYYQEAGRFSELVTASELGTISDGLISIRKDFNDGIHSTVSSVFEARKSELKGRDGAPALINLVSEGNVPFRYQGKSDTPYQIKNFVLDDFSRRGNVYTVVAKYRYNQRNNGDVLFFLEGHVNLLHRESVGDVHIYQATCNHDLDNSLRMYVRTSVLGGDFGDIDLEWICMYKGEIANPPLTYMPSRSQIGVPARENIFNFKDRRYNIYQNNNWGALTEYLGIGRLKCYINNDKNTKDGERLYSAYINPPFDNDEKKLTVVSFRVVESSKPIVPIGGFVAPDGRICFATRNKSIRPSNFHFTWGEHRDAVVGDYAILEDFSIQIIREGEPILPTPYAPHLDDLKVTADEVSASLIASVDFKANLSVSTARLLNNNTEFKKAVKGEKGDKGEQGVNGVDGTSVTLADLNIRWNGTSLVVGGVTSGDLKGQKGDDGKSVKLSDLGISWAGDRLTIGGVTSESLKGETGARGPQGAQGAKGADGKSVTIADLKANASFMQHTAREVAKFGEFATTVQLNGVQKFAIRPRAGLPVTNSDNPFATIINTEEAKVLSLLVIEGTDLYLPPASDCAVGTKIYLTGGVMSCSTNQTHSNTQIRPIRLYSSARDVYFAGQHTDGHLLQTFTNAEWRVDLECIVSGCGLKGWLWTNRTETTNIEELETGITTIATASSNNAKSIKSLAEDVEALKAGEHKITIKSLRDASNVSAPLNTLQMTHDTTANSLYLPSPSEGLSFRLWANHWVNKTITIHKPSFPSNNFLINTATNTQISSLTLIAGHLYDFVAVSYNTWIVTDLSR